MKMYVTKDNGPYKRGAVVTMDEKEALHAFKEGWAQPVDEFERAVLHAREVRA